MEDVAVDEIEVAAVRDDGSARSGRCWRAALRPASIPWPTWASSCSSPAGCSLCWPPVRRSRYGDGSRLEHVVQVD